MDTESVATLIVALIGIVAGIGCLLFLFLWMQSDKSKSKSEGDEPQIDSQAIAAYNAYAQDRAGRAHLYFTRTHQLPPDGHFGQPRF